MSSFHRIWVDIYELRNTGEPRRDFYTIFVVSRNWKTGRRNHVLGQIIATSNRISLTAVVRIWSISVKLVTLVKIKLALPTIHLLFEQSITVIKWEKIPILTFRLQPNTAYSRWAIRLHSYSLNYNSNHCIPKRCSQSRDQEVKNMV